MYIAHDSVFGLNARVSSDRQQGKVVLGYDRDFATILPKSVEQDGKPEDKDVMSSMGCSRVEVTGIHLTSYSDAVATGAVAKKLAKDVDAKSRLFDCDLIGPRSEGTE